MDALSAKEDGRPHRIRNMSELTRTSSMSNGSDNSILACHLNCSPDPRHDAPRYLATHGPTNWNTEPRHVQIPCQKHLSVHREMFIT